LTLSSAGAPRLAVIVAYALPALASQFVFAPFTAVLPGIYAKHFGVSASAIALVLLLSRTFDAVSDPLIGYWSDATRSRLGQRKPWIVVGAMLAGCAIWNLARPDPDASVVLQLAFWSITFYLGWTMMEIPHTAWGAELTNEYGARNRVFFVRTVMSIAGPLGFAAIPLLIQAPTTEMTPDVLRAVATSFLLLAPACVGVAVAFAPSTAGTARQTNAVRIEPTLRAMVGNGPLWRLLGIFVLGGLAAGINGTLQYIYLDTYLGIGDKLPYALGAMMVSALLALPLWLWVLRHVDKHQAWALSLASASLWVLAPAALTPNGDPFVPFLIMVIGLAVSSGAGAIVPFSLLADVIDLDEWRTRVNRGGAYFAVFLFGVKINSAIGGSIAFAILALVGYDATSQIHGDGAVVGLKMAYCAIPALLFATAAAGLWSFPLNRRRQEALRRALGRRVARREVESSGRQ
jgi:GPH family glycoside/pentoside/hexuronide:cation symporter